MALNIAIFNALAPEFASYDPSALSIVADIAATLVNQSVWGSKYDAGVAYMTAHMLKMAKVEEAASSGAGPVTMEKVGDRQVQYGSNSSATGSEAELKQTRYGAMFLQMRRTLQVSPFIA